MTRRAKRPQELQGENAQQKRRMELQDQSLRIPKEEEVAVKMEELDVLLGDSPLGEGNPVHQWQMC